MGPTFLSVLAPVLFLGVAAFSAMSGRRRPGRIPEIGEAAALLAFGVAIGAAILLILSGAGAWAGFGIGVRLDAVSAVMLVLVSFVGWVVLRYARTFMDGEPGHDAFTGWLCATLASVLLLVQAGTLIVLVGAWVATSLCLHRLLLFYPGRPAAWRAARKKFIFARFGDGALISAAGLLIVAYRTVDIGAILDAARNGEAPVSALVAAALIGVAALLKSAQFPTHGWLTEVMEAPTPVSALLHAGVVNAGGFLMIRFADVMLLAPGVLAVLAMIGGFTAIYASLVMLTQPAVKTSLAWSTIAQMGFMTLQCGLALFPLALLHIVAHSLYKAHAFLAAGEAVVRVAAIPRPGPVAVPNGWAVLRAFAVGLFLYGLVGAGFGIWHKSPQAVALGAILIFGVAYLLAQGFADAAPRRLTQRTAAYALAASIAYFALQSGAVVLTQGVLPPPPVPGPLEWAVIVLAILSFGSVAAAQALFPLWVSHPAATGLRIHLSNGLYANAILDRLIGGWRLRGKTQSERTQS